jgi:hypothetical protein
MVRTIKASREITGIEPKEGYEWDAGYVPDPASYRRARITVRKDADRWEVTFVAYLGAKKLFEQDSVIAVFDCETCAKAFALNLVFGHDYAGCAEHSNEFISEDDLFSGTVSLLMGVLGISEQVAIDEETVDRVVSVAQKIFAQQLDWHSAVELWEQFEGARKLMSLDEAIKAWHSLLRNL